MFTERLASFSLFFTTAGLPAAMQSSGMFFVTTLPAAMMQREPMVTPGHITDFCIHITDFKEIYPFVASHFTKKQ